MKNYAVVHFQPVEFYPPVQNLVNLMAQGPGKRKTILYTTSPVDVRLPMFEADGIIIRRFGKSGKLSAPFRYINYLYFWFRCLLNFILSKPSSILYYETNSFPPVFFYKNLFNRKVDIFCHYHEFTSILDYRLNKLNWFIHRIEIKSYWKMKCISHTNTYRMNLFLQEHPNINANTTRIIPNFPPKSWLSRPAPHTNTKVKFVYVGAVSTDTMYLIAFAEWVKTKAGSASWDIYSNNITDTAKEYLSRQNRGVIRLHEGIPYSSLSSVLPQYQIGVILYKGHVENYVYNAPNKLFEYLAFGLDVWFPHEMIGSSPYITTNHYPKVIALNFLELDKINIDELINRFGLNLNTNRYYAEDALDELLSSLYGY